MTEIDRTRKIGLIGAVLAKRLLAEGFCVCGYDVAIDRTDALKRLGGQVADGPAAVASEVDCLLNTLAVQATNPP
jgi:3-hydroxyisobutyrate dehydrogenase-like beta-hydroxyacid dehydrogenase